MFASSYCSCRFVRDARARGYQRVSDEDKLFVRRPEDTKMPRNCESIRTKTPDRRSALKLEVHLGREHFSSGSGPSSHTTPTTRRHGRQLPKVPCWASPAISRGTVPHMLCNRRPRGRHIAQCRGGTQHLSSEACEGLHRTLPALYCNQGKTARPPSATTEAGVPARAAVGHISQLRAATTHHTLCATGRQPRGRPPGNIIHHDTLRMQVGSTQPQGSLMFAVGHVLCFGRQYRIAS